MAASPTRIITNDPHQTYGFRKCCGAICEAVPIEEVARRYTDLKTLGGRAWFTGRCPLPDHEDKTPSFYIYPPGRFYCYGCGSSGDVVDLEFHCGDYGELWEAMIALSLDPTASLSTVSLRDLDFGSLLGAFGGTLSIFVTLSLLTICAWRAVFSRSFRISDAVGLEYGVELPKRPESWYRTQERQKPVRDGIEAALIRTARRRLYKRYFEPIIAATVDPEDRAHDEQELWEATLPLAEHLVGAMMRRAR
jgi:hypothetical protein